MIGILAAWITAVISAGGYGGVAAMMLIESACIPLPSEIIMPFAGYLVSTGRFSLWAVALAGAVGCNLGSTLAWWIGATGARRFVDRYGRWILLDHHDLDVAERFFARFGGLAVFVGRLLPVVRTFIALPAGMGRMRQFAFQSYTFVGSFIWCWVLATIGEQLGRRWESDPRLRHVMQQFHLLAAVVLAVAVVLFLWHKLRRRAA